MVNGEGFSWWWNSVAGEQDPKWGIMHFSVLPVPFLWFQFLGWCRDRQLPSKLLSTKWATTVTCHSRWHRVLCSKFSGTKNNLLRYFRNILRWALEKKNVASVRINFKVSNIFPTRCMVRKQYSVLMESAGQSVVGCQIKYKMDWAGLSALSVTCSKTNSVTAGWDCETYARPPPEHHQHCCRW